MCHTFAHNRPPVCVCLCDPHVYLWLCEGSRGTGQVCAWAVIGRRPVQGRRPAASGFWETHTARVLIKNTQETLSTDAWGFWTFLTHSHSYTPHMPSTGSNSHYFLLFLSGAKCRKCIDTYFNFILTWWMTWCLWQQHLIVEAPKLFVPIFESVSQTL